MGVRLAELVSRGSARCRGPEFGASMATAPEGLILSVWLRFYHAQVVGNVEDRRHLLDAHGAQPFIGLVVNHSFQGDIAAPHDDMNRRDGKVGVFEERTVVVNCAVDLLANPLVHGRGWKNLDMIDDRLHSLNSLN